MRRVKKNKLTQCRINKSTKQSLVSVLSTQKNQHLVKTDRVDDAKSQFDGSSAIGQNGKEVFNWPIMTQ